MTSLLRTSLLSRATTRAAIRSPAFATGAPRAQFQLRRATQDYGSGDGNPAGEKPLDQGPSASEGLEHPGPAAPKVGKKGEDKKAPASNSKGSESSSSSGSSSSSQGKESNGSSKEAKSQDKQAAAEQGKQPEGQGKNGAQPKILNEAPPDQNDSPEVREHNKDMDNRAEKAHNEGRAQ